MGSLGLGSKGAGIVVLRIVQGGTRPISAPTFSREIQRILALPVDPAESRAIKRSLARVDQIARWPEAFRPVQKRALASLVRARGLFAPIGVGEGKTLITLAAASLFPDLQRPILIVPAHLRGKTLHEWRSFYDRLAVIRSDLKVVSFNKLSSHRDPKWLERHQPQIVIVDECQYLRHPKSARTRRFLKFAKANRERCVFVFLSGSITRDSIKDYAHLIELALGSRSPLPRPLSGHYAELESWASVLDVDGDLSNPGALARLMVPGHEDVRDAFRDRLAVTRGVVMTTKPTIDTRIEIRLLETPRSEKIEEAQRHLESSWTRPDGWELAFGLEVAHVRRQLLLGGFYRIDWPDHYPVRAILDARREYARAIRELLGDEADTPGLVEAAIRRGVFTAPSFDRWNDLQRSFPTPPSRWVWIDHGRRRAFVRALEEHGGETPSLVWSGYRSPAQRLAKDERFPFYGQGLEAARGVESEARRTEPRTIVLSTKAHGTGRNLQAWCQSWIYEASRSALLWEQLIGRTHRTGQRARVVRLFLFDCWRDQLAHAIEEAHYIEKTTGNKQRLLMAEIEGLS